MSPHPVPSGRATFRSVTDCDSRPVRPPECPQSVPSSHGAPRAAVPSQLLKAQVDVVVILGELVATVTAPHRRVWPLLYPESLHAALRKFIWNLRDTLDHGDVTSLHQRGVTSLSQAVATLKATPGATWADVTAVARPWREWVDVLRQSWDRLGREVLELQADWEIVAINEDTDRDTDEDIDEDTDEATTMATDEDTAEATATSPAGDQRDKTAGGGTAADSLMAATVQLAVFLSLVMELSLSWFLRAQKAREEAEEATSQAGVATKRREQAEKAQRLLGHLVVTCMEARLLPCELLLRLGDMEFTLKGTQEVSTNVPEAVMAAVAEAELLWEASARLTTRHLLVAPGEIDFILSTPYGASGGPCGLTVAERCQKAIEDILRLLEGCGIPAAP